MTSNTSSPVVLEQARLRKAEQAMDVYCTDLADVCGRPERDELTAKIYKAAREARNPDEKVEDSETPSWVSEAGRGLVPLAAKVKWNTRNRIDNVLRYDKQEERKELEAEAAEETPARTSESYEFLAQHSLMMAMLEIADPADQDARRCLARAEEFFDPHTPRPQDRQNLAVCLLDFAFVRIDEFKLEPKVTAIKKAPFPGPVLIPPHEVGLMESQMMLGRTIRWGGTALCLMGLVLTKAVWLIPMLLVAHLMAWVLIDKKAIERRIALEEASKQKALEGD